MAKTSTKSPTTFKPGKSGNPAGRPRGSKNATTLLKEAVTNHFQNIIGRDMPKVFRLMLKEAMGYTTVIKELVKDKETGIEKWVDRKIEVEPDKEMQKFLTNKFLANAGSPGGDQSKQAITAINITVTKGDEANVERPIINQ